MKLTAQHFSSAVGCKLLSLGCLLVALFLWTSCSGPDTFTIKGTIDGAPSMNITITYYAGDALRTAVTVAQDGKFEIKGSSRTPVLVDIHDGSYKIMGSVYIANGQTIECQLDRNNPFKIRAKGEELTERWCQLVNPLADSLLHESSETVNGIVERYISAHPDDQLSALFFSKCYNASISPYRADSVVRSINEEAQNRVFLENYFTASRPFTDPEAYGVIPELKFRTTTDSVYRLKAKGKPLLLAFVQTRSSRNDSVVTALRQINREKGNSVRIVELSVVADTFSWRRSIRMDSAKWVLGWAPGEILAEPLTRLAVPTLPYFIVADTAGRQTYRGPSITAAQSHL